jgi:hypothetical protein
VKTWLGYGASFRNVGCPREFAWYDASTFPTAIVACFPTAWPARVDRIAPGPQSAVASVSEAFAAAADPADAAMPSVSAGAVPRDSAATAGDAPTAGSPTTDVATTDVATTAGGFASARAAPFGGGDGCAVGFALAADGVGEPCLVAGTACPDAGEDDTAGFAAASGFAAGFVALPFVVGAGAEVGRAVTVATGAVGGCDCTAGEQPASTSKPSMSAESRITRDTGR